MKKLLLGTVFAALSIASASAADLYVKARPMVPTWVWDGLYVGVNIGTGIPDSPRDTTVIDPTPFPTAVFTSSDKSDRLGVIGGGQLGYNKVVLPWLLLGLEADIQGADLRQSNRIFFPAALQGVGSFADSETRLNWFGTLRARGGWLVTPETMLYATGGLAFGDVKLNQTAFSALGGNTTTSSASETKTGWTVGGGIETRLWNSNWTAKAEYLYVDLGSLSTTMALGVGGLTQTTSADFKDHIVRVGVNYKLGNY
jgi:outer membrane immunogenic protein